jgi:hypothetical protein
MKRAELVMAFICLLVPNGFCATAFSQSKPDEKGSQQPASESVDTETSGEPASADEAEQQPSNDSANAEAINEEAPDSEPIEYREPEAGEVIAIPTEGAVPAPSPPASQPAVAQSTNYNTVPLVSSPVSPKPSSGTGLIIAGSIVTGIGVLNLLAAPLCYVLIDSDDEGDDYVYSIYGDDYEIESTVDDTKDTARDICVIGSLVFGGLHVVVGLPLLLVGLDKRSDYNEWREKNPELAGFDLQVGKHRAVANWKTAF